MQLIRDHPPNEESCPKDEELDLDDEEELEEITTTSSTLGDGLSTRGRVLYLYFKGFTKARLRRARPRSLGTNNGRGLKERRLTSCRAPSTHGVSKYLGRKEATYLRGTS
jgi:hypothetical protein